MSVNLSVKNVSDRLVEQLRARAGRHHRSLQGELMAILEEAVTPRRLSLGQVRRLVRESGVHTGDESTAWTRELRDGR